MRNVKCWWNTKRWNSNRKRTSTNRNCANGGPSWSHANRNWKMILHCNWKIKRNSTVITWPRRYHLYLRTSWHLIRNHIILDDTVLSEARALAFLPFRQTVHKLSKLQKKEKNCLFIPPPFYLKCLELCCRWQFFATHFKSQFSCSIHFFSLFLKKTKFNLKRKSLSSTIHHPLPLPPE